MLSVGGADEGGRSAQRMEGDGMKPAKMRSSVACFRCRRSKIKCMNSGTHTTCRACEMANRECTYPAPASMNSHPAPKRAEPPHIMRNDGEADVKRPRKKDSEAVRKQSRDDVNALENPPITKKMWTEISAAFILHFSADLHFLHEQILFSFVGQTDRKSEEQDFLLGILTLTARYIPELVAHHSPGSINPRAASEYYANALTSRLDATTLIKPSLERCQALLMLALYCWGECRGTHGWMWTGCAISMAELLGLFYQEDSETELRSQVGGLPEEVRRDESRRLGVQYKPSTVPRTSAAEDPVVYVKKEIRRRTMYSIFILDRYMATGSRRRQRIKVEELKVQLPCSDSDFRFGLDVKTGFLYSDGDRYVQHQILDATQGLGIYIQLVEIWSRLSKWTFLGGRRIEHHPPWDPRSEFSKLRKSFDDFHARLPEKLALNSFITESYINTRDLTVYVAIHTLYSLCRVVLHREYTPFIAIGCDCPCEPLDEPLLPKDKYPAPPRFWEESAEQMFKAASDIMDVIRITSQRGVLVESPPVAFAVWTAAFVGIYSISFPHMDSKKYMCDRPNDTVFPEEHDERWSGKTGLAIKTLREISPKLVMAQGWMNTIRKMFTYFVDLQRDHKNAKASNESDAAAALKSLRSGGVDGGRREYELVEKDLNEFGRLDDRSVNASSEYGEGSSTRAITRGPSMTPGIKNEHTQGMEGTPRVAEGRWAAVNDAGPLNGSSPYRATSVSDFGAREAASALAQGSYYQHRGVGSNPAPLLSPPNTSIASNFNSSYATNAYYGNDNNNNGNGGPSQLQHQYQSSGYITSDSNGSSGPNLQRYGPSWLPERAGQSQEREHELSELRQWSSIAKGGDATSFGQGISIDDYHPAATMYDGGFYEGHTFGIADYAALSYNGSLVN